MQPHCFSEDGMSVFLAEPDDNKRGSHSFPPNASFTQASLSIEDGYPLLKLQISGQIIRSYIIGLFHPDYSDVLDNQKSNSAPVAFWDLGFIPEFLSSLEKFMPRLQEQIYYGI